MDAAKEAFRAAQQAAAGWEEAEAPGRVVFVVSSASLRPVHGDALDAAAGGFLTTIGQVGAVELGGKGITVNTVVHGRLEGEDTTAFVDGIPGRAAGEGRGGRGRDRVPGSHRRPAYVNGARPRRRRRLLDHEDTRRQPARAVSRSLVGSSRPR